MLTHPSQKTALDQFNALPWPEKTSEEWRRSDLAGLIAADNGDGAFSVRWDAVPPEMIHAGVILTDLTTALKQFPGLVAEYLFKTGTPRGLTKFALQNQALTRQGLFCYIPDGVHVDLPMHSWIEPAGNGSPLFPRVLVVVGEGASATLIDERRSPADSTAMLCNEFTEVLLKADAKFSYIRLQRWNESARELFGHRAVLKRNAHYSHIQIGLGGEMSKANLETILSETGAKADLLGILFGSGKQHFDFNTLQAHEAPHTTSDLLYKSVLKDTAKSIYTGLIRIEKEAKQTDAYQDNRSLLLSQGAKADSIPRLEILTDDVQCKHGVAVGPVDEDQVFYLMSRGLPRAEAERLIVSGFFNSVLSRVPVEALREELAASVSQRI